MLHHYHRIHSRLRGVRSSTPSFPAGSLSPAQILTAYGFKQNQYASVASVKLGIGSLGGGVVQKDIDNSVKLWGMRAPTLTVRTVGGASNDPSDQDSNVENMLDIVPTMAFVWWWLTGRAADITICFGPNASGGMEAVTRDLVAAGCEVCSWSWGSAASQWDPAERASLSKAFADAVSKGVFFCAASGDNSVNDGTGSAVADYPAADPSVWAVGGTRLVSFNTDGTRAVESAWGDGRAGDEGGGGGFDPTVTRPTWQQSAIHSGTGRGVPDTSANADPNSGWQMSANGAWTVVGGTSAASPFTAALIAIARGQITKLANSGPAAQSVYVAQATNDILTGSNGDPASSGWDPATGLGSPAGDKFIAAVSAWLHGGTVVAPPPIAPTPTQPTQPLPPVPKLLTLAQAQAVLAAGWPK